MAEKGISTVVIMAIVVTVVVVGVAAVVLLKPGTGLPLYGGAAKAETVAGVGTGDNFASEIVGQDRGISVPSDVQNNVYTVTDNVSEISNYYNTEMTKAGWNNRYNQTSSYNFGAIIMTMNVLYFDRGDRAATVCAVNYDYQGETHTYFGLMEGPSTTFEEWMSAIGYVLTTSTTTTSTTTTSSTTTTTTPPIEALPRLSTSENRIVDEDNHTVLLKGVSIADPYWLDTQMNHIFTEDKFAELVNWHVNVVRIPIHPGAWRVAGAENIELNYLDKAVEWGKKYGFYIIIDWHGIGNPQTGHAQGGSTWGAPSIPIYDSDPVLWKSAWAELAGRYSNESNVIFELFNEPAAVDGVAANWQAWRDTLRVLIDNIRTVAPKTLILVSGWQWTNDLSGFLSYPLRKVVGDEVKYVNGIAYVCHVYATHTGWESSFGAVSRRYPVVITEWGFSTSEATDVASGCRENYGQTFLRYMYGKGVSWTAWCFDPSWGPAMLRGWNYMLTDWGAFVKEALTPDSMPPTISISSPSDGSTVQGTVTIEGTASDNLGLLTAEVSIDNGAYQSAINVFDPSSYRSENWSFSWKTRVRTVQNGTYTITARVTDTAMNVSTVSITVVVNNPIDSTPPISSIDSPFDNAVLSGVVMVSGTASDENGIENIILMIDNDDETAFSVIETVSGGLFIQPSVSDNNWSVSWDTTNVSSGVHTLKVIVVDNYGGESEDSISVDVTNGDLFSDCDNYTYWSCYAGGGATMAISSDNGVSGNSLKATYTGSGSGWWGIARDIYRDLSGYSGIEFYLKGTAHQHIRLMFSDSGREQWIYLLIPTLDWEKITLPFENLSQRADWQPAGVVGDLDLDLNPVWSIQIIHSAEGGYQGSDGTFWIDNVRFIE